LYDYLKGRLVEVTNGKAVIENNGVGFSISLPPGNESYYNSVGQEVVIYTRLMVKDDEMYLYGFASYEERRLFNLILGISGFGPRTALSLLGILSVSQLYVAVLEENVETLSRAPGVGRKAAQRLILELKEKLPGMMSPEELAGSLAGQAYSVVDDVTEALCNLGYSRNEAIRVLENVVKNDRQIPREELLKKALRSMAAD